MRELDEILKLRRDIENIDERLWEVRQMTQPKAQTISDMPRGGERKNAIEEYIVKSEELRSKRKKIQKRLDKKWRYIEFICAESEITEVQLTMLKLRFYYGNPWKRCVTEMQKLYTDTTWNEQKLFRKYRKILYKIDRRKSKNIVKNVH